jgi:hypothetical protein
MPFDNNAFTEYVDDSRYDLLKKPIKIDKSNRAYEIQQIPPATAISSYVKTDNTIDMGAQCWNGDGSLHYIDVYAGSDYKPNMLGTYIYMKYHCAQVRTTAGPVIFKGPPIAPLAGGVGTSIPWNPLYAFNTVALKLNQAQTPVEQYINAGQLSHISTARYLQKYKKDAMENNDLTFFTPCIESKFDNATISPESATRSINWTGANGLVGDNAVTAGPITYYEKMIPLSDFFESCENPAIWTNCNRFRFEFTMKTPNQIGFSCGAQAGASGLYFYVDSIKMMFDSSRMQAIQTIETASLKQIGTIENIAYYENFVIPTVYNPNSQLVATGQRDVQQLIVGFPALANTVGGSVCVNPIQYFNGQLSSLSVIYGSDMPLRSPLTLGSGSSQLDSSAYVLYRKACGSDRTNIVPLAVSFFNYPQYHLYFLPIYNPILPHRNNDPKDLRVDTTSTLGAPTNAVLIMRKFAGVQIDSSGAIDKI